MANEQKLTPWFPESVSPVREGVYELPSDEGRCFSYWNGERFCYREWTYSTRSAEVAQAMAFKARDGYTCLPEFAPWRGLAEQPK